MSYNDETGILAEKIIEKKLTDQFSRADIQLFGGNNPGYDIKMTNEERTLYIEVKSTKNRWAEEDILLSKKQYEKAKEEGDSFWLIVVEKVKSETDYVEITVIKNPLQHFIHLQLDHGWKEFGEEL